LTHLGVGILVCAQGCQMFKQPLASWPQVPEITWFTMMDYPPFLLSDNISTSQLLPLLTLWLLVPESERVIDKSSKAIDPQISKM